MSSGLKRQKRSSISGLMDPENNPATSLLTATTDEQQPRKKQKTLPTDPQADALFKACKETLDEIKRFKDSTGRQVAKLFLALPSKKLYPDYYMLIRSPISLSEISEKLVRSPTAAESAYTSLDELKTDLKLMFDNACLYNVEGSEVYRDAKTLLELSESFIQSKAAHLAKLKEIESRERDKRDRKSLVKDDHTLMNEAIEKNDVKVVQDLLKKPNFNVNELYESNIFATPFSWTPLHCAAYHGRTRIISTLIDAGALLEIKDSFYQGTALAWAAFTDQIKAARTLVRDYEANRNVRNADNLTPYDLAPSKHNVEWFEMLPDQEQPLVAPEEFDEKDVETEPVMLALYFYLLKMTDSNNRKLCEFFVELPTRKDVPNYYTVIKNPMSFKIIERRFYGKYYTSLYLLGKDLELIFQNAMSFNLEGSQVYSDARQLKIKYERAMEAAKHGRLHAYLTGKVEERVTLKIKPPKVTIKLPTVSSTESLNSAHSGMENEPGTANSIFTASAEDEDRKKRKSSAPVHIPMGAVEVHEQKAIGSQYQQQYIRTAPSTSEAFNPPILDKLEVEIGGGAEATNLVFDPSKAVRGFSMSVGANVESIAIKSHINISSFVTLGGGVNGKIYNGVCIQSALLNSRKIYPRVPAYSEDVPLATSNTAASDGKVVEHEIRLEEGMNMLELITLATMDEKYAESRGALFEAQSVGAKPREVRQVFRLALLRL